MIERGRLEPTSQLLMKQEQLIAPQVQNSVYSRLRSVIDSSRWKDDWYDPSVLLLLAAFPIVPHGFGKRGYLYNVIIECHVSDLPFATKPGHA